MKLTSDSAAQAAVSVGVLLLGILLGLGALSISSAAGYGGVGPNFLPWLVSGVLSLCGLLMLREALTGGFRSMPGAGDGQVDGQGDAPLAQAAWWPGLVWISAGLLANAALITTIGFILSCALCYLLAVQGLRRAAGQSVGARTLVVDLVSGACIAAPVYWAFTQFLGINLPGLTNTGWL